MRTAPQRRPTPLCLLPPSPAEPRRYPLKSSKRDVGLRDVPVTMAGVVVAPGDWVYADKDGVLVSKRGELKL